MTADDDYKLLNVGIGFTNMVERATKGSADLTRKEIKRGTSFHVTSKRRVISISYRCQLDID
jgi:TDG/mug DNA glycosylase family protein